MKVLILFIIAMFASAASPRARSVLTKRWVFVSVCIVVALSFFSLKVSA